jgi:hypothetical protein
VISRKWESGDKIELDIPMPVRKVIADERIRDNKDKIAVQKGPLIFCAEWPDNNRGNVLNMMLNKDADFTSEFIPDLLGGTQVIRTSGFQTKRNVKSGISILDEEPLTLIPYALWNNRGPGEMMVWLPVSPHVTRPLPAPTIAFRSKVRAGKMTKSLSAVNDQLIPFSSDDRSVPWFDWWPVTNRWEWIEYDFAQPETISKTKVYWFDDRPGGGCRVPLDWEILYLNGNIWEPVIPLNRYKVTKDAMDSLMFDPVETESVKIKVLLGKKFSGGIYEWVIE